MSNWPSEIEYFDRDGRPLDMQSWAQLQDDMDYKIVAVADIEDTRVSTVWLGLDHAFVPGTRHTFETMLFGGRHSRMWRWCSADHAAAGHRQVIAWLLREGPEPIGCWGHLSPTEVATDA